MTDRKNSQKSSSPNVGTLASLLENTSSSGSSAYEVGTAANGGTLMSDGSIVGGGIKFGSVVPPLAVAGIGAYTAKKTGDAYQSARGKGAKEGFKEGLKKAGPLKFVPLLGQAPAIAGAISGVIGGNRTEREDERRGNLAKQGINLYNGDKGWEEKYNAVINPNFAKDFVGADDKGNWVNNKFASTRDESALTGRDIDKYAAWSEMFGDKWNKASDDIRYKIGDEAVKRGLLREHHGTLDVNSNDEFNNFASSLLDTPTAKPTQQGQRRDTRGISPRKEDPKERRVASRKPAPPVNLDAILPRISQPEPFVNYDNEPTQEETTQRNRYKDAILAQLMSRV